MPKKNKLKGKTEENLEKEWKKLRKKIKINLKKENEKKKQEKKEEEESELEEGIEESERVLEESEFHEFIPIPQTQRFVPVLQRVERRQQEETLEKNLASTPVATQTTQDKTDDMMKYSMSEDYASEEKRKYQTAMVLRNIETAREFRKLPKQELSNPSDWIMTNPWSAEREEKIDTEFIREEAKLPFEKKDKKYKEFKL